MLWDSFWGQQQSFPTGCNSPNRCPHQCISVLVYSSCVLCLLTVTMLRHGIWGTLNLALDHGHSYLGSRITCPLGVLGCGFYVDSASTETEEGPTRQKSQKQTHVATVTWFLAETRKLHWKKKCFNKWCWENWRAHTGKWSQISHTVQISTWNESKVLIDSLKLWNCWRKTGMFHDTGTGEDFLGKYSTDQERIPGLDRWDCTD